MGPEANRDKSCSKTARKQIRIMRPSLNGVDPNRGKNTDNKMILH